MSGLWKTTDISPKNRKKDNKNYLNQILKEEIIYMEMDNEKVGTLCRLFSGLGLGFTFTL